MALHIRMHLPCALVSVSVSVNESNGHPKGWDKDVGIGFAKSCRICATEQEKQLPGSFQETRAASLSHSKFFIKAFRESQLPHKSVN